MDVALSLAILRQTRKVWKLHQSYDSYLQDVRAYDDAIDNVYLAYAARTSSPEHKKIMAETFVDFCKLRIRRGEAMRSAHTKTILELLQDKALLSIVLENPDGDRALAWNSQYNALFREKYVEKDTAGRLHLFLTTWLGHGLPNPTFPKLIDVLSLQYGGHCATSELLGFEGTKEEIQRMWDENKPIIKTPNAYGAQMTAIVMPESITME